MASFALRSLVGLAFIGASASGQSTERVSVDSARAEANAWSDWIAVSADGNRVAFTSYATNLVPGDTNGFPDLFLRDRAAGTTLRMSLGEGGVELDDWVGATAISADGLFVAVDTASDRMLAADQNGMEDVFVVDVETGAIVLVSVAFNGAPGDSHSGNPSLSADGRYVAFVSDATNLVPSDQNGTRDVFVRDLVAGTTERVSLASDGSEADGFSDHPSISADGRYVAFHSLATNLDPGNDIYSFDIFVHDRTTGSTIHASVDSNGATGNGNSSWPSLSADGTRVAFDSDTTNLVPNDVNGRRDIFVRDLVNGVTSLVSADSTGNQGNADSAEHVAISGDGTRVAFLSWASNLVAGDSNARPDIFVRDLASGMTERISVASDGAEGDGDARRCAISEAGAAVVFVSTATNLVPADQNVADDVFVHESCETDASWSNYGTGFPGTNGVPDLTSQDDPALGTSVTLDLTNSSGLYTVALLFVGFEETLVPTSKGGDLLVVPAFSLLLALTPTGATIDGDIPDDEALCGLEVYLQAIEIDPGAAKGLSFTPGLKLVLGH